MHLLWAQRVTPNADAAHVADAMVATWLAIEVVLNPVLGQQGVVALYKRSVFLTRGSHPWFAALHDNAAVVLNVSALRAAMMQEGGVAAIQGGDALLRTFHDLLVSLVGSALTERLMQPTLYNSLSGPAALDINI